MIGFVASLITGAMLARTSLFLPGATAGQLRDYYSGSQLAVVASSLPRVPRSTMAEARAG